MPRSADRPQADARAQPRSPADRRTVLQGGRPKAYRPLPPRRRRAAFLDALAAYERGDVFLAHELLEPAWMGTPDELERELYQGLIKLAAAGVHEVRGNPAGELKNLRGARTRLEAVLGGDGDDRGVALPELLTAINDRIEALEALDAASADRPRRRLRAPEGWAPTIPIPRRP